MTILIALGGNALLRRGDPMTTPVQGRNIRITGGHEVPDDAPGRVHRGWGHVMAIAAWLTDTANAIVSHLRVVPRQVRSGTASFEELR
ncbi:MAG: hypothetical protein WAK82_24010 [Streptosporangiaceae bacterium]